MDDESELSVSADPGDELCRLMLEVLSRIAAGEIKRGDLGVDDEALRQWYDPQMGE